MLPKQTARVIGPKASDMVGSKEKKTHTHTGRLAGVQTVVKEN